MINKPKIAFFGTPERAVKVLDELKRAGLFPALVVSQPDKASGRKLAITPPPVKIWSEKEGIPVLQPENPNTDGFVESLKKEFFDIFVVVAYGRIFGKALLDVPKLGSINLHASLLPLLRGSSPIESAILTDRKNTGVTIMLLDEKTDHGPILAQEKISPEPWPISAGELSDILLQKGSELLIETIPKFLAGEIKPMEQDHSKATFTKKIKKEDGMLELDGDGYGNYLKFLAFREWPKTFFWHRKDGNKMRVIISGAKYQDGEFIVLRVIPEGRKEMSWSEFDKNY